MEYVEPLVLKAPLYNEPYGESLEWRKTSTLTSSRGGGCRSGWRFASLGRRRRAGLALLYRNRAVQLRAWREQVLTYFATGRVSNGGTEAINLMIEKTRRLTHGFRNFTNYRLRILLASLLAASGDRPYRRRPDHA